MKLKSLGLVLLVVLVGLSLAGCSCFEQKMKGETPPPAAPEKKMVVAPTQKPEIVMKKEAPRGTRRRCRGTERYLFRF